MSIKIEMFFHLCTSTLSYVVYDKVQGHGVIIDSALDFSANTGVIKTCFADQQLEFIRKNKITIEWVLETHAHADHLTASHYLKAQLGAKVAIGIGIIDVLGSFKTVLAMTETDVAQAITDFDTLLEDGDSITFGQEKIQVLATPGHTSDSVSYLIDGNAFVGDSLFMPDFGTARCDFPGGDANQLYNSISRLHALPDDTMLWVGHDYQPGGRDLAYCVTVAASKKNNIHVNPNVNKAEFVRIRQQRDSQLDPPKLLYPAIQVNIRAGLLPKQFFIIPVKSLTSW
jgi:glyoxylase-like metal-dependent hydrolase (beta-lactamase superfamily II)